MTSELDTRAARMSAADFLKQVTPAARRSKLFPWAADIRMLRDAGCSLSQIRAFLAQNGVSVAVSTLNAFIARHVPEEPAAVVVSKAAPIEEGTTLKAETASAAPASSHAGSFKSKKQLAAEHPNLSPAELRDRYARQFEAQPSNPLADLIRQQEDRKRAARAPTEAGTRGPGPAGG
ncbi:hypothetical protein PP715_23975 [Ralstonia solanacearum]|uniref:hypothetical protein n=1 Tax=Ralstonia solanacearum TaxID=305 RepID=UPI0012D4A394|nr:hypothetical protein [Ralstonia solanacearum]MCL9842444.1 hypothetical protein [Ralstonia solanacearum]MDB0534540.1 hypothetical protein [Ralstonia solanacearum]MDB0539336.1 hypothetical protein [Ralstonia solanacearum]MDB0549142.1 hypothetical protein [Ralstonia solanacearum]MDB0564130.1 hypothetical protein [Ralstonia solanacearum]